MMKSDGVDKIEMFKYLGSILQKDGIFEKNIKHRIKCEQIFFYLD